MMGSSHRCIPCTQARVTPIFQAFIGAKGWEKPGSRFLAAWLLLRCP